MSRKISFTVESEEKRAEIEEYAIAKGFRNASTLARVALYQYIFRYPLKNGKAVQPAQVHGKSEQVCDVNNKEEKT